MATLSPPHLIHLCFPLFHTQQWERTRVWPVRPLTRNSLLCISVPNQGWHVSNLNWSLLLIIWTPQQVQSQRKSTHHRLSPILCLLKCTPEEFFTYKLTYITQIHLCVHVTMIYITNSKAPNKPHQESMWQKDILFPWWKRGLLSLVFYP